MDYGAGWGNRRNRDGTAPPVLNIHLWGRKTVPGTCEKIGFTDFSTTHFQ
jgi:hypothetical protein